ncbi:MAG: hypothetical protein HC842_07670 [Cytophagales bacterium]|nr:hypothetical protein [Cytophagales bacterium]
MSSIFASILASGCKEGQPAYLNNKVALTNRMAVGLFAVASIFVVVSLLYFPQLTYVPVVGQLICLSTLFLNRWGSVGFTRFLISIAPISLATMYLAYGTTPGQPQPVGMTVFQFALIGIPFLLIDMREGIFLGLTVLINTLIFFAVGSLSSMLLLEHNIELFHSPGLDFLFRCVGVGVLFWGFMSC